MEVLDDTVQNFNFVGMSDLLNLNFRLEVLMKVKIIDTYITEDYSNLKHSQVKKTIEKEGKIYTLLTCSEHTYRIPQRIWLGIRVLAKTLFSLGFGLISVKTQSQWKSFFSGKQVVAIYTSSILFLARKILAESGDIESQFKIGMMYFKGDEGVKNTQAAFNYIKLAADQKHAEAEETLGEFYEKGFGVEQNPLLGMEYYKKAAEHGNLKAQYNLGVWYDVGCGVEHNAEKALEYFELAAAQGDEDAKVHVERLKRSLCIVD